MQTIKEAREARGITQKAVADHLRISRQAYAGYEKKPSRMPVGKAELACEFIGVNIGEIFFGDDVS